MTVHTIKARLECGNLWASKRVPLLSGQLSTWNAPVCRGVPRGCQRWTHHAGDKTRAAKLCPNKKQCETLTLNSKPASCLRTARPSQSTGERAIFVTKNGFSGGSAGRLSYFLLKVSWVQVSSSNGRKRSEPNLQRMRAHTHTL